MNITVTDATPPPPNQGFPMFTNYDPKEDVLFVMGTLLI